MDFTNYLFRSSGVHNLMAGTIGLTELQERDLNELIDKKSLKGLTDKQQKTLDGLIIKKNILEPPTGAKTYLKKLHREETYKRRTELKSKYINKGNAEEENAITMYSLHKGEFFINNKERIKNAWISGEYDIYLGKDILNITEGFDTKCSWSLDTLPFKDDVLDSIYYWQNQCYMDLSNCDKWTTVYCLINLNDPMINDMIYRESFKYVNQELPEWKKLSILNNHIYDEENFYRLMKTHDCMPNEHSDERCLDIVSDFVEIPVADRIVEKTVYRDDKRIQDMHKRVEMSRVFLNSLNEMYGC